MVNSSFLSWFFMSLFLFAQWTELFILLVKARNVIKTVSIMDRMIVFLFLTSTFPSFLLTKKEVEDG